MYGPGVGKYQGLGRSVQLRSGVTSTYLPSSGGVVTCLRTIGPGPNARGGGMAIPGSSAIIEYNHEFHSKRVKRPGVILR